MENTSLNSVIRPGTYLAHSNFKKGLADYNDGSSLNHNLGNDDYAGSNELEVEVTEIQLGYEALGNDLSEIIEESVFFS